MDVPQGALGCSRFEVFGLDRAPLAALVIHQWAPRLSLGYASQQGRLAGVSWAAVVVGSSAEGLAIYFAGIWMALQQKIMYMSTRPARVIS